MSLENLNKKKASKIIGIDCSTKSLAYAIFEDDKPIECGEVFFDGSNFYDRLNSAREKTEELVITGTLVADYVAIEKAVYVSSQDVAIQLAYFFGAVLSVLTKYTPEVINVAPITWQTAIGVPNLKTPEKNLIKTQNPNKSDSWYKAQGRKIRKDRILKIAEKNFAIPSQSDNIGDACGLALYASTTLTHR